MLSWRSFNQYSAQYLVFKDKKIHRNKKKLPATYFQFFSHYTRVVLVIKVTKISIHIILQHQRSSLNSSLHNLLQLLSNLRKKTFENIVGKTENSGKQHFLLSSYPFPKQALVFTGLLYKSFENTVGKGEIARNEQFLLFPQCFLFQELSAIFNRYKTVVCKLFQFQRV